MKRSFTTILETARRFHRIDECRWTQMDARKLLQNGSRARCWTAEPRDALALERDWRCCHVVEPRAVRENERNCSSSGSPTRPILLSSQIAFYGRCRSILSTSVTKANVDLLEKAHKRRNEKATQNALAITSPVFTGPRMVFPLIYREITTDLEEPGSFGFFNGRK